MQRARGRATWQKGRRTRGEGTRAPHGTLRGLHCTLRVDESPAAQLTGCVDARGGRPTSSPRRSRASGVRSHGLGPGGAGREPPRARDAPARCRANTICKGPSGKLERSRCVPQKSRPRRPRSRGKMPAGAGVGGKRGVRPPPSSMNAVLTSGAPECQPPSGSAMLVLLAGKTLLRPPRKSMESPSGASPPEAAPCFPQWGPRQAGHHVELGVRFRTMSTSCVVWGSGG